MPAGPSGDAGVAPVCSAQDIPCSPSLQLLLSAWLRLCQVVKWHWDICTLYRHLPPWLCTTATSKSVAHGDSPVGWGCGSHLGSHRTRSCQSHWCWTQALRETHCSSCLQSLAHDPSAAAAAHPPPPGTAGAAGQCQCHSVTVVLWHQSTLGQAQAHLGRCRVTEVEQGGTEETAQ